MSLAGLQGMQASFTPSTHPDSSRDVSAARALSSQGSPGVTVPALSLI